MQNGIDRTDSGQAGESYRFPTVAPAVAEALNDVLRRGAADAHCGGGGRGVGVDRRPRACGRRPGPPLGGAQRPRVTADHRDGRGLDASADAAGA